MNRITSLKELSVFTPKLLELHQSLEGRWEPELTAQEFLVALINHFSPDNYFFGEIMDGEIVHFAVVLRETEQKALFWLFYMNPKFRTQTKNLLHFLKAFFKREGFICIYSQSTRTASSYERWLEKFGAQKIAIVYKFPL